jgi:hypothetical protein
MATKIRSFLIQHPIGGFALVLVGLWFLLFLCQIVIRLVTGVREYQIPAASRCGTLVCCGCGGRVAHAQWSVPMESYAYVDTEGPQWRFGLLGATSVDRS